MRLLSFAQPYSFIRSVVGPLLVYSADHVTITTAHSSIERKAYLLYFFVVLSLASWYMPLRGFTREMNCGKVTIQH